MTVAEACSTVSLPAAARAQWPYLPRNFAEFQYRFNRRYDLPEMLDRLGAIASKAPPRPRKLLKIAYVAG